MLSESGLQNTDNLFGKAPHAADGIIRRVMDFYCDDETWMIRYVVVDTGSWLSGRLVLLSPHAFGEIGVDPEILRVALSKQQIEDSPSIENRLTISRQYEKEYYHNYEYPTCWTGGGMMGMGLSAITATPQEETIPGLKSDSHLRSMKSVKGYQIEATDGALGHLSGFMIGGEEWKVHELIIETGLWHLRKQIPLAPDDIETISYEKSTVSVRMTKEPHFEKGRK